jgi:transposase-like protein
MSGIGRGFTRKMTDEQKKEAAHLYCWGISMGRLAKKYGVSITLISAAIKQYRERANGAHIHG